MRKSNEEINAEAILKESLQNHNRNSTKEVKGLKHSPWEGNKSKEGGAVTDASETTHLAITHSNSD